MSADSQHIVQSLMIQRPSDPQAECEHPARGPLARPPRGAASLNSESALMREVKPLNSKQPYNRVHRQTQKNPYDSRCD